MNTLVIRHVDGSNPPQFQLVRLADGKPAGPSVAVVSPAGFPVEGRPDSAAPPAERAKMRAIWEQAGLPELEWPE